MSTSPRLPRSPVRRPFGCALALGLAMVATGPSGLGGSGRTVAAAQAGAPCALLTDDDVQSLASNASVSDGVSASLPADSVTTCRYTWGEGRSRVILDVTLSDASRMFAGMTPNLVAEGVLRSVTAGTSDAVIPDVGEAAVFKADSPLHVHATAYVKGRILQVVLDGFDAREKKDDVIAVIKSAASRL